ncbi:hypothetical protein NEF87_000021 [Candidatus Lokiarchaeum ossiferum]|uniref:Peptidase C14 caspase domain-containing protein n=1 Tax=Candidatus Lokiarchaeum ossiferum TaxID=2951803 RepID=A0ABY6HJN6_9ARCH|nr:hypothetical protein NEF87_000021 [Candidatus Lokiarchaeum sp. B-35]
MKKFQKFLITFLLVFSLSAFMFDAQASSNTRGSRRPPWEPTDAKPVCSIVSPTNGEAVEGIVSIVVSATDDNGVIEVVITVDGVTIIGTTYDWDTTGLADGSYSILATATDTIGQTTTDSITVNIGNTSPGTGDGIVNKYAVIIGISDYDTISDLSFCDEDANDWYNYLAPKGYQITLLGDNTNTYARPIDGIATEANMKQAVADILAIADADDIIVYATSGHGTEVKSGNGRTATYKQAICAWDCSAGVDGEDGLLYDSEFATMWVSAVSNVFIFIDHCFSGGMDELFDAPNADCFYMTTTCSAEGLGYDASEYSNGMWTYWFLEAALVNQGYTDLHEAYVYGYTNYSITKEVDLPCEFGVADFNL